MSSNIYMAGQSCIIDRSFVHNTRLIPIERDAHFRYSLDNTYLAIEGCPVLAVS